jgi:hypothetical protein
MSVTYCGWLLDPVEVALRLQQRPAMHPIVRLHHVTHAVGTDEPPMPSQLRFVGHAGDEHCECYVVQVMGTTTRPDGRTYHATISRTKKVGSEHSNVILQRGWEPIEAFYLSGRPFGRTT